MKKHLTLLSLTAALGVWAAHAADAPQACIVVAQDGSGDHTRVQDAVAAAPRNQTVRTIIFIKSGTYKEKIVVPSDRPNLMLVGQSYENTILTYDDYAGKMSDYASTRVKADDFTAVGITFQNTIDSRAPGIEGGQAAALRVDGDRALFYRCRIMGFQDTYYTGGNRRSYHKECVIVGTTDFIYGDGIALFEDCTIYNRSDSHVTAHSQRLNNGEPGNSFGYVFKHCKIERYPGEDVSRASLGRPWRNGARVVYLHCEIGSHIRDEGWSVWNRNDNHLTAYYAEYKNSGPGYKPGSRPAWTRQLNDEQAGAYTKETIFKADTTTTVELQGDWNPTVEGIADVAFRYANVSHEAIPALAGHSTSKPRVIATTDGEIDDHSSMIRFLLYTCDFDVAGIVEVNSKFQKHGHSKEPWLENQLASYEQVSPNLRKHNPDYPSADYLRSVCRVGNENIKDLWVGPPDMETKNTPGEQLIIDTLLDTDPRPVHVLSWGGANTTASALWKLKTEYPKATFDYAVSRIRIYCIWYQDGGGGWIQTNTPGAYINEAHRWDNVWDYESYDNARGKGKRSSNPPFVQEYMKPAWLNANVKVGHGRLGAMTPQGYISEGDTPSFLHLVSNGLEAHFDYTLGGWGGRSAYDNPAFPNHITDQTLTDDGDRNKMYWRWIPAAQNDFAARLDWCVKEFKDANHAPVAKVQGALKRDVKPGEIVNLAATAIDPDGNKFACKWWQYADADSAAATVTIANSDTLDKASFVAPNEPGKQVHIILEATDNGIPPLVGYRRVIFSVR